MKKSDKLEGGRADNKKPSDFDPKQLDMGIKHEMEHTKDKSIAKEIAMDHLAEDPKYYEKLKDIEKYDRVDVEADGKKELDYGKEELDKVKSRWKKLKKALKNEDAIMDISSQEYHDEDEDQEEGQDGLQVEEQQEPHDDEEFQDDQIPEEMDVAEAGEDSAPPESEEEQVPEEGAMGESAGEPDDEEIARMLQEAGYSDAEIAHVMHGHIQPEATVDDVKVDAENAMSEHKLDHQKRMDELNYELASQEHNTNEMDKDHKQRILDLEFAHEQKMKAMELKFKEEEYKLKLEGMKDKNQRAKVRDADRSRNQDAAKTSKKEKAGK